MCAPYIQFSSFRESENYSQKSVLDKKDTAFKLFLLCICCEKTFDCRVKEELGVGRDQIKMLSARCSLQHLSKPDVCVRARAMFVTAGKQILKHNEEN